MVSETVTVVTGGGSGIGAAVCRMLAAPGQAILVHTGSNRGNAESVAAAVEAAGAKAVVSVQDFSDPRLGAEVIEAARAAFGRVDRVVHVAGTADRRPFGVLDEAGYERGLVAPRAFFHLVTAALPLLRESPAGRVVSVGSFLAHEYRLGDEFLFPATSSAKAALVGLTKSLAMQLAAADITVNCVVPGFIQKDPGRHAALDDAARARVRELVPMRRFRPPGGGCGGDPVPAVGRGGLHYGADAARGWGNRGLRRTI